MFAVIFGTFYFNSMTFIALQFLLFTIFLIFSQSARDFSFLSGMPPSFSIVDVCFLYNDC